MTEPRGIRNNNPLNIKRGKSEWRGRMPRERMTPVQAAESVFEVFESPEYGIRAAVIILTSYLRRSLDTPAEIIGSWAPPSDNNDTPAYVDAVAKALDVPADRVVDTTDPDVLLRMFRAMIRIENGIQPYDDATIMRGILLGLSPREAAPSADPKTEKVAGQVRHALTWAGGISAAVLAGLLTEDEGATLTAAGDTLFTDRNMEAALAILGVLSGAGAQAWSWLAKKWAEARKEKFA